LEDLIANGQKDDARQSVDALIKTIVSKIKEAAKIGAACPHCGNEFVAAGDQYKCSNSDCNYTFSAKAWGVKVPPTVVAEILNSEDMTSETKLEFVSKKTGNPYQAPLRLDTKTGRIVPYFPSPKKVAPCPKCKRGEVEEKEKLYSCSRWNEGCDFKIWKGLNGPGVQDVQELFRTGQTSNSFTYEFEGRKTNYILLIDGYDVTILSATLFGVKCFSLPVGERQDGL
jgi:hypothetical protein